MRVLGTVILIYGLSLHIEDPIGFALCFMAWMMN